MRVKTRVKEPSGDGITLPAPEEFVQLYNHDTRAGWYRKLSVEQRLYIDRVAAQLRKEPSPCPWAIAKHLKSLLKLRATLKAISGHLYRELES